MDRKINYDTVALLVADAVRKADFGSLQIDGVASDRYGFTVSVAMPMVEDYWKQAAKDALLPEMIPDTCYVAVPVRLLCGGLSPESDGFDDFIAMANLSIGRYLHGQSVEVRVQDMDALRKSLEAAVTNEAALAEHYVALEVEESELNFRSPFSNLIPLGVILPMSILNRIWNHRFECVIIDPVELRVWAYMYGTDRDFGLYPSLVESVVLPVVNASLARDILKKLCSLGFADGADKQVSSNDLDWCAVAKKEGVILRRGDQVLTDAADVKFCARAMYVAHGIYVDCLTNDCSREGKVAALAKAKELADGGWLEVDETVTPSLVWAIMDDLYVELVESGE